MNVHRLSASLAIGALFVAACSGSSTTPNPATGSPDGGGGGTGDGGVPVVRGIPCDVDAILEANCRKCHASSPLFGAPMPLVTHDDLVAAAKSEPSKKVYELAGARTKNDASPMPPPPNPRLSSADQATLDAWIAAGAPKSTEACGGGGKGPDVKPLACQADQKIRPTAKWKMGAETDAYVCYGFDTSASARRHVIAGAPVVDNAKIVHHILLYQSATSVSGTPTKCGAGGNAGWRLVTGWAPGGKNFELPPEAGFAEETGTTHWAVQIHYNNAQGLTGEEDASGYDLCSTDKLRANDADIFATGTTEITIPGRSTHTTTCEFTVPQSFGSIKIFSAWPHMHKLGRAQWAKRVRAGAETTILDEPNYDFSVGGTATGVNIDVAGGDVLRTMCKWQNPDGSTVKFGEGTGDEMCFAFFTYYPKIQSGLFHWGLPAAPRVSTCQTQTE